MKVVLLCGGLGSRLDSVTQEVPKPLVKIGGHPIIVHLMNIYAKFGHDDFILCAGYMHEKLEQYFMEHPPGYKITIVNTGLQNQTGSRLKQIEKYIKSDNFLFNYSDGLSNVNINSMIEFHLKHKRMATMLAVNPPGRFGVLDIQKNLVAAFKEKPNTEWINGGFFVLNKEVFDYLPDNIYCAFEHQPLEDLAKDRELVAFKHPGFWKCMDTRKDRDELDFLLKQGDPPWI